MVSHSPRIVFITIPGNSKRAFVNALHTATQEAVELVVVQKQLRSSFLVRFLRFMKGVQYKNILKQFFYAFLLRFSIEKRRALNFFRATSKDSYSEKIVPKLIEVDSVNSDYVYQKIKAISPDLIVVWGSSILQPRIIATAKKVINLHLGLCPYYRGAVANQYAFFQEDFSKIGATIHYVNNSVDAGNIIQTIPFFVSDSIEGSFKDLNDRAFDTYLQVAIDLAYNKSRPSLFQDTSLGKNILLKYWTPELRYKTAKKVLLWNKNNVYDRQTLAQH
jgi:folate-dependent phosphoribosylglycinamide formyltransferase PurN